MICRPPVSRFLVEFLRSRADSRRALPTDLDAPDWDALLTDAEREGLTGLLYRHLEDLPPEAQPSPACFDRLKAAALGQAAVALRLTHELAQILIDAARRNLPCIPIRGPALAEQLYADGACRPMSDLDLLVRREDLTEVDALLKQRGYQEVDRRPGFARSYSYTLEFLRETDGISVEPHWTIAYPPLAGRLDMQAVWQRSTPCMVAGVESRRLSPSDLWLHLAFHFLHKQPQAPLLWAYELDRLVRQHGKSMEWPLILRQAAETGQDAAMLALLEQLVEGFNSPVPSAVLAQVPSGAAAQPAARLRGLLQSASVDGRESLALFLSMRGWRARLRYALDILFPSPAFMRRHYGLSDNAWLGWHYLGRLLRLCREGLRGLRVILLPGPSPR